MGNFASDAQTFAEWGVDYVMMDGCFATDDQLNKGFPAFGEELGKVGRDILYSCKWPAYTKSANFEVVAETCNTWRSQEDVQDSWNSLKNAIQTYVKNQDEWTNHTGPGAWNDMDVLEVGNFGLSDEEAKTQMAIWALISSPLIMSTDLRHIREEQKEILMNKHVIDVSQDSLAIQGKKLNLGHVIHESFILISF